MSWLTAGWVRIVGLIVGIVLLTAVGFKVVQRTTKTTFMDGSKQVIVNKCEPEIPLIGCSIWKVKLKAIWQ